jgi:site-specific recombinase XerD
MHVRTFRRHSRTCPHKAEGRAWERCGCAYWADPRPIGPLQSLGTKDRATAEKMARDMELSGAKFHSSKQETDAGPITIEDAKKEFLDNLSFLGLATETVRKHKTLLNQCESFAKDTNERIHYVREFDSAACARFAKTWQHGRDKDGVQVKQKEGARARGKKLERLRQFFKFCVSRKWIEDNPTTGMKGPIVKQKQTPPFTPNEMTKILAEADKRIIEARTDARSNAARAKALILFLRFSGLRIGDAVGCQIEWVKDGRVRLITRKTDVHVDVELPPHVTRALSTIRPKSDLYFFWTGNGAIETAVKDWQGRLLEIFTGAGINGGHPHRFRDTFAVAMLERGESLQAVADALGNTLAVTQHHYNAWSKTRQSKLDEAVRGGWSTDPLLRILDDQEAAAKLAARGIM